MFLEDQEIRHVTNLLKRGHPYLGDVEKMDLSLRMVEREWAISYLATHPYLLFPFGFDEARTVSAGDTALRQELAEFLTDAEAGHEKKTGPFYAGGISHEVLLRASDSKDWWNLYGIMPHSSDPEFLDLTISLINRNGEERTILETEFLSRLQSRSFELPSTDRICISGLWIPISVDRHNIVACDFSSKLLSRIKTGAATLADITWQELEDAVAELLTLKGMKVTQTKRTRDGGRDLIAVGELFPGFESRIAVEVTQRKTVGIEKIAKALYQNRNYPTIMIATSGSFTAGVVAESQLPENCHRLVLADGDLLAQWVAGA